MAISTSVAAIQARDRLTEVARARDQLGDRLASTSAQLTSVTQQAGRQAATISRAQDRVADLRDRLEVVEASKVRTVVETEVVTERVIRWIPNGREVSVEVTGYEGLIGIHDVQLTHAFGYSDLIGIAVNRTGQTLSYVQLGCTFLDAKGRILANQIVNRQSWAPGQTWGFSCSGQVDAEGGILRVDEMV
jgi:hypothetical protein